MHVLEICEEQARDGEILQVFHGRGFVPLAAAQRSVLRLECPWDKRRKPAGFFLQTVDSLQVVDAVLELFADAEHHGGSGSHAELVRSAVHVQPVFSQALQTRNTMTNFVVQNFRAATRDGIESGIAQAGDRVANG